MAFPIELFDLGAPTFQEVPHYPVLDDITTGQIAFASINTEHPHHVDIAWSDMDHGVGTHTIVPPMLGDHTVMAQSHDNGIPEVAVGAGPPSVGVVVDNAWYQWLTRVLRCKHNTRSSSR